MAANLSLLRTDVRDLRRPEWTSRGSRYWTQAEVPSRTFFVLEGSGGSTGRTAENPMRFIAPDFFESLEICKQWSMKSISLLVYTNVSDVEGAGYVFGKIREAFGSSPNHPLIIHLASGSTLLLHAEDMSSITEVRERLFPLRDSGDRAQSSAFDCPDPV